MDENFLRMKELRLSREKHIKKLTKLLSLLVKTEWEVLSNSSDKNDNIGKVAAKSISEASSCIQTAISQLISTATDIKDKDYTQKKADKEETTISTLKKVLINKNK